MTASASREISAINELLNDKLFQVIGSTPKSIAESLTKIDLKGKSGEGAKIFAVAVFASAVNKSTLETFLADPRFTTIRPLLSAALSISGRANMTALTLLGHCLLTTPTASTVNFTAEFRKKMGQNDLWSGELTSGSLSDKQKEILREKKRLTDKDAAYALGAGFLKWTGLDSNPMTRAEADLFNTQIPAASAASQGGASAFSNTGNQGKMGSPTSTRVSSSAFTTTKREQVEIPTDVLDYRKRLLKHSDADISESIERNGLERFIANTRELMARDPTGRETTSASTVGRK